MHFLRHDSHRFFPASKVKIFPNNKNKKDKVSKTEKAGSVHDLRRFAVSSLLKVPPQYTTFNHETQRQPFRLQDHQSVIVTAEENHTNQNHQNHNSSSSKLLLFRRSNQPPGWLRWLKFWPQNSNRRLDVNGAIEADLEFDEFEHGFDNQASSAVQGNHGEDFQLEDLQQKRASL